MFIIVQRVRIEEGGLDHEHEYSLRHVADRHLHLEQLGGLVDLIDRIVVFDIELTARNRGTYAWSFNVKTRESRVSTSSWNITTGILTSLSTLFLVLTPSSEKGMNYFP